MADIFASPFIIPRQLSQRHDLGCNAVVRGAYSGKQQVMRSLYRENEDKSISKSTENLEQIHLEKTQPAYIQVIRVSMYCTHMGRIVSI